MKIPANFEPLIQDTTMSVMYSPRAAAYQHVKERAHVRIPANFPMQNMTLCVTMGMTYSAKVTYPLTCDNVILIFIFMSTLILGVHFMLLTKANSVVYLSELGGFSELKRKQRT